VGGVAKRSRVAPPLRRLRPSATAAGLIACLLLIAGCGGSDESSSTTTSSIPPTQSSTTTSTGAESTTTTPRGSQEAAPAGTAQLYFTSGEQFHKVDRKIDSGGDRLQVTAEALLDGPIAADAEKGAKPQTAIPPQTALEDVSLAGDGTATVDVSAAFMRGVPVDPADRDREQRADLAARLGQVTYTLSQLPGVKDTKVVAGGEPVVSDETNAPVVKPLDYSKPVGAPGWKAKPRGEKSLSTKSVQQRLAQLQYLPPSAVDGVDGYRTQQAVIAFQAWEGLDRDGVVGPATTAALSNASAPKPSNQGPSRRIEVYRSKGVALEIAHGKVRRAIHVSSGQPGLETPPGTFHVFRKELRSWSVPFQVWLPFASYFNNGIAFHEYPDVPPYPASHGCVRVPSPEAPGVYKFAKLGTTVIVF
jgi:lipoprotein-anchoring transpeptidase ErfK/SrfK/spore germination protein GerM